MSIWIDSKGLTPDLPLYEMAFDPSTDNLREWVEMWEHLDSPEWQLPLEFYARFLEFLRGPKAEMPALEKGRPVDTVSLLNWFASETRQLLDKHAPAVEALAAELLSEKRLQGDRYVMSGPDLESFLTSELMR
jgi:hypothetical protein